MTNLEEETFMFNYKSGNYLNPKKWFVSLKYKRIVKVKKCYS